MSVGAIGNTILVNQMTANTSVVKMLITIV